MIPFFLRLTSLRSKSWMVTAVVGFSLFTDYFLYGLIVPLTPYLWNGISHGGHLEIMYSGYAFGVLAATPLFAYAGNRLGYHRAFIGGGLLSILAAVLFFFPLNFYMLFLARVFMGAASAATWTAGFALVAEHYITNRVKMMGFVLMGSTAGSVAGPFLGGWLHLAGGVTLPLSIAVLFTIADTAFRFFLLSRDGAHVEPAPDIRKLLLNRSIIVPALAVALAAFGWSIIEPILPSHLNRTGVTSETIGLMFTLSAVAFGISTPVVSWASMRLSVKKVMIGGTIGMAVILLLLGLSSGTFVTAAGLCLLSSAFAFTLNPTAAELGNAVDRQGMSCYSSVYAVYNIAYSLGMIASNAIASAASRLSFLQVMACISAGLILCVPFLLRSDLAGEAVPAGLPVQPE